MSLEPPCLSAMTALAHLYSKIPKGSVCPDGCKKCCGPVSFSKTEATLMGLDRQYTVGKGEHGDTCEFVNDETGKCDVYENRPFICRFFNSTFAEVFKCSETPTNGGLTPKQGEELIDAYIQFVARDGSMEGYFEASNITFDAMDRREKRNGWRPRQVKVTAGS